MARIVDVAVLRDACLRQAPQDEALVQATTPMMSDSFMIRSSSPSIFTSVPDHLPNSTLSPVLRSIGMSLPASSRPPGPTATTSPCEGFSLAVSGMMMPPLLFSSASTRFTTTRSCRGRNLVLAIVYPRGTRCDGLKCLTDKLDRGGC